MLICPNQKGYLVRGRLGIPGLYCTGIPGLCCTKFFTEPNNFGTRAGAKTQTCALREAAMKKQRSQHILLTNVLVQIILEVSWMLQILPITWATNSKPHATFSWSCDCIFTAQMSVENHEVQRGKSMQKNFRGAKSFCATNTWRPPIRYRMSIWERWHHFLFDFPLPIFFPPLALFFLPAFVVLNRKQAFRKHPHAVNHAKHEANTKICFCTKIANILAVWTTSMSLLQVSAEITRQSCSVLSPEAVKKQDKPCRMTRCSC